MNLAKSLLWGLAGTIASLAGGYVAFLVLAFVLGPGIDIDDKGTPVQKFFGAAAFPALCAILFCGTLVSWVLAFAGFHRR